MTVFVIAFQLFKGQKFNDANETVMWWKHSFYVIYEHFNALTSHFNVILLKMLKGKMREYIIQQVQWAFVKYSSSSKSVDEYEKKN